MNDTIFGKIIRGEIPASKVYEDEEFLAFLDVNPVTKGHTLLIPKVQYRWVDDVPDEVLARIFVKAKELIKKMRVGLHCDYVEIGVVGMEVEHFHIHLIPHMFHEGAAESHRPRTTYDSAQEMNSFAEKISTTL